MDAEEILHLFDSYWFEHNIFKGKKTSPSNPVNQEHHEIEESNLPSRVNLRVRSFSDRCLRIDSSFFPSPRSVITTTSSKLPKILSGQEISDFCKETEEEGKKKESKMRNRRRRRPSTSRSLSDLEFEEVKGFMDLGFVFTEEDKKSNLVSIIPGLQRWGETGDDEQGKGKGENEVSRPYLSEAWEVFDQIKTDKPLMHWRFPAMHNEINMKDNLKAWAHSVASNVI